MLDRLVRRNAGRRARVACRLLLALLAAGPIGACADDLPLLSLGVRMRIGERNVLGRIQPESFTAYDAVARFRSPWGWYASSGWGLGLDLLTAVGVLQSVGQAGLVGSALPLVALGRRDGRWALDFGAGAALLSRQRFGRQTFGGPAQFALTAGITVPVFRRLAAGYRYLHYSDASLYGSNTIGVDLHMIELAYRM